MHTPYIQQLKNILPTRALSISIALLLPLVFLSACNSVDESASNAERAESFPMVSIAAGELKYYPAGEYLRNGFPSIPAMETISFDQDLSISARQVSQHEYAQCVAQKGCRALDKHNRNNTDPELPVVGVSWQDATDYAQWLSAKTGHTYRLPSYDEWVYAAGSAYKEDLLIQDFDESDPAQRWLAEYALETQRKTDVGNTVMPFGEYGVNEHGLMDVAGNVWDWTNSCHVRQHMDQTGFAVTSGENCGVRVVAGAHRSYIPDFIRDAKSGACSVGVPPSNLGFRLVRILS